MFEFFGKPTPTGSAIFLMAGNLKWFIVFKIPFYKRPWK